MRQWFKILVSLCVLSPLFAGNDGNYQFSFDDRETGMTLSAFKVDGDHDATATVREDSEAFTPPNCLQLADFSAKKNIALTFFSPKKIANGAVLFYFYIAGTEPAEFTFSLLNAKGQGVVVRVAVSGELAVRNAEGEFTPAGQAVFNTWMRLDVDITPGKPYAIKLNDADIGSLPGYDSPAEAPWIITFTVGTPEATGHVVFIDDFNVINMGTSGSP